MNTVIANKVWIAGIGFLIVILTAIAITQRAFFDNFFNPVVTTEALINATPQSSQLTQESSNAISKTVDPSNPAPAKKLHKLLTESDDTLVDTQSLDKKIQSANQQIEDLNARLQAQGITVLDTKPPTVKGGSSSQVSSNTEARLQAIRAHMAQREQQ